MWLTLAQELEARRFSKSEVLNLTVICVTDRQENFQKSELKHAQPPESLYHQKHINNGGKKYDNKEDNGLKSSWEGICQEV